MCSYILRSGNKTALEKKEEKEPCSSLPPILPTKLLENL